MMFCAFFSAQWADQKASDTKPPNTPPHTAFWRPRKSRKAVTICAVSLLSACCSISSPRRLVELCPCRSGVAVGTKDHRLDFTGRLHYQLPGDVWGLIYSVHTPRSDDTHLRISLKQMGWSSLNLMVSGCAMAIMSLRCTPDLFANFGSTPFDALTDGSLSVQSDMKYWCWGDNEFGLVWM